MGRKITLTAEDGHEFGAWRSDPDGKPHGGIVVIQEIFGVNGHIRSVAERFADRGYSVIAPALFDRAVADIELDYDEDGMTRGRELRAAVGWEGPVADIAAAAEALREAGKVGTVGFCWGGSLAWLAATRLGLPSVGYYGGQIAAFAGETPKAPVLLHFGDKDQSIPMTDVEKVRAAHPDVPIHVYPAGHGFNCDARASYHEESAEKAFRRTIDFFAANLD